MFRDRCSGAVCTAELCNLIRARRYTARLELVHSLELYEALSPAEVVGFQMNLGKAKCCSPCSKAADCQIILLPLSKADSYLWTYIGIVASNNFT